MHEPLKNRTYVEKKLFFNFLVRDFLMPKSSHQREKQPVLGTVKSSHQSCSLKKPVPKTFEICTGKCVGVSF